MQIVILSAFAKFRRATASSFHICPYVRMNQIGSRRKDFHEILPLNIIRKSFEKIKFSLKSDKNNWYYQSLAVSSPLCILELSRLTRIEEAVKNTNYFYANSLCTCLNFVNEISSPPDFNGCIALLYISSD